MENSSKKLIKGRKNDHIEIVNKEDVETATKTWLECANFIHNALPDIDLNEIDNSTQFLRKKISAPLIFNALTGGTELGKKINEIIAHTANKFNLPVGVGSQRIALEHPEVAESFSIVRKIAPDIPVIANIGVPQILKSLEFEDLEKIVKMIDADALAVHLNALQESIQPEGETIFKGAVEKIQEIKDNLDIPIIVKETGAGISKEVVESLFNIGVKMIDISGVGGTSWSAIEFYRKYGQTDKITSRIGKTFWDWGIPTAACVLEARSIVPVFSETKIIASGGIRTGLDIAKCIALGANYAGLAKPMLKAALLGQNDLNDLVETLIHELKVTMFLTGSKNIEELSEQEMIILPPLLSWMEQRKISFKNYQQ